MERDISKQLEKIADLQGEYDTELNKTYRKLNGVRLPNTPDVHADAERVVGIARKQRAAILQTAESTKAIQGDFKKLHEDLSTERDERKNGEKELRAHTDKYDKRNFILGIIGAVTAGLSLIVSILVAIFK